MTCCVDLADGEIGGKKGLSCFGGVRLQQLQQMCVAILHGPPVRVCAKLVQRVCSSTCFEKQRHLRRIKWGGRQGRRLGVSAWGGRQEAPFGDFRWPQHGAAASLCACPMRWHRGLPATKSAHRMRREGGKGAAVHNLNNVVATTMGGCMQGSPLLSFANCNLRIKLLAHF